MEINYFDKYNFINHGSRILKPNRMNKTSYMDKKKIVNKILNKNIIINIRIDNKLCKDIDENENKKGRCKNMDIKYK